MPNIHVMRGGAARKLPTVQASKLPSGRHALFARWGGVTYATPLVSAVGEVVVADSMMLAYRTNKLPRVACRLGGATLHACNGAPPELTVTVRVESSLNYVIVGISQVQVVQYTDGTGVDNTLAQAAKIQIRSTSISLTLNANTKLVQSNIGEKISRAVGQRLTIHVDMVEDGNVVATAPISVSYSASGTDTYNVTIPYGSIPPRYW